MKRTLAIGLACAIPAASAFAQATLVGGGAFNPEWLVDLRGTVLFIASSASQFGRGLWRSDGTTQGTSVVIPGFVGSAPTRLTVAGDAVFFFAGTQLWRTDGTTPGTQLVAQGWLNAPVVLTAVGDQVFFAAVTPAAGLELWCSDGTPAGTRMVRDIAPGPAWSAIQHYAAFGDRFFFCADDGVSGPELWVSDGTAAGTQMALEIVPGPLGGGPNQLTVVGDRLYFSAWEAATGTELYGWDGVAAQAQRFDLFPGSVSGLPRHLTRANQRLYFEANTPGAGSELCLLDASGITVFNLAPGQLSAAPDEFTAFGDRLLFSAAPLGDREPWISDGTAAGTVLLRDLGLGASSNPAVGLALGSRYAVIPVTNFGRGLYRTDGTTAGTQCIFCPPTNVPPDYPTLSGGRLFFTWGGELYVFDPGAANRTVGAGCGVSFELPTLRGNDPVLGQPWTIAGDAAPGSAIGVLALSIGMPPPVAYAPRCLLWVDPAQALTLPASTGTSSWSLPIGTIPNQAALTGLTIAAQAVFLPVATATGVATSNGIYATIGL